MKKIMFNDKYGLTEAVLHGCKTMTRRLVPHKWQNTLTWISWDCNNEYYKFWQHPTVQLITNEQAPYKVGEVVAIAQSYKETGYTKEWVVQHVKPNPNAKPTDPFEKKYPGWNNKMFVKAELMLNFIQFTANKIERLQDISDEDCLKEGVYKDPDPGPRREKYWVSGAEYVSPRSAFAALIDKVSGRGTWDKNPWVFAYTFDVL